MARQHQQLHVEGKPIDRQPREQRIGRVSAEQLEAALGIVNAGEAPDHPHVDVEEPADGVPQPVLADPLGPGRFAGADHDMGGGVVRQRVEEAMQVVGRHRKVGVCHEPPGAACFLHPAAYSGPLSCAAAADQPDARVTGGVLHYHCRGAIAAPIIDDDDFPRHAGGFEVREQRRKRAGHRVLFVVGRDDYREIGRFFGAGRPRKRGRRQTGRV
jgi:hypothetical protein